MKIALFEDNPVHALRLKEVIQAWAGGRDTCVSVEHFPSVFAAKNLPAFDCLLLDVEMPGVDGLQFAREIRKSGSGVPIVFVSSHTQYSIDGYEVSALRFIDKNAIDFEKRVFECMDKVIYEVENSRKATYVLKSGAQLVRIPMHEILYFEMYDHYLITHTVTGDYRERKTFAELEKELPAQFVKIGRSFLVNVLQVQTMTTREVTMRSGAKLPIARGYAEGLLDAYLRFR